MATRRKVVEVTALELARRLGCDRVLYPEPGELVNQQEIATWLGISDRAVRSLVEVGLPTIDTPEGTRYPTEACVQWHTVYRRLAALSGYRRAPLSPAVVRHELDRDMWERTPDGYVLVPVSFMQALQGARIRIDHTVLRRLEGRG